MMFLGFFVFRTLFACVGVRVHNTHTIYTQYTSNIHAIHRTANHDYNLFTASRSAFTSMCVYTSSVKFIIDL